MSIIGYRGDTLNIVCLVTDSTGAVFDLSTYTGVEFTVRAEEDDTVLLTKALLNGIVITNALGGEITVTIDAGDTSLMDGQYVYDIEITDGTEVYTVSKGMFEIVKDVTHT